MTFVLRSSIVFVRKKRMRPSQDATPRTRTRADRVDSSCLVPPRVSSRRAEATVRRSLPSLSRRRRPPPPPLVGRTYVVPRPRRHRPARRGAASVRPRRRRLPPIPSSDASSSPSRCRHRKMKRDGRARARPPAVSSPSAPSTRTTPRSRAPSPTDVVLPRPRTPQKTPRT